MIVPRLGSLNCLGLCRAPSLLSDVYKIRNLMKIQETIDAFDAVMIQARVFIEGRKSEPL